MELSEVRSLGERMVLKLRLGCDTAGHKQPESSLLAMLALDIKVSES